MSAWLPVEGDRVKTLERFIVAVWAPKCGWDGFRACGEHASCEEARQLFPRQKPGERFLIRDRAHRGDEALWWKPDAAGYTVDVDRAGRYRDRPATFSEKRHEWVPESRALALAGRFVRVDDLQHALDGGARDGA